MIKIKAMLGKLRLWIIHRLGGCDKAEIIQPKIELYEYHPVTIKATYRIRKHDFGVINDPERLATNEVHSRLVTQLLQNIEILAEVRREENVFLDTVDYTAYLRILIP